MRVSILVAVAENGAIGKDNQLIWRLSDDLKNFKKLSSGHSIIMGRKTFDSIGRPLPQRHNIVISRNEALEIEGAFVVQSLTEALALAKSKSGNDEVFIIGGAQIYALALPHTDRVYLTRVQAKPDADAFFDLSLLKGWTAAESRHFEANEKNEFAFDIVVLEKPQ
ncbi:dihydrofolate reductase [Marinilongibacter aquaticus]|uniref:dihydrofolate reductase n=1 Tax=Marinilongibacter aquaticus TaxID=2975157 RepID=UPI0021BD68D7|nr:dihydrofolate reductase [Marinilongibacter aquaticus]UBM60430.1 dihydrofolate reductase [Marinilongibacter aquaticus]